MDQKEFSNHIFEYLTRSFPEFVPSVTYKNDDSFDCELKSPSGEFAIWITTYDREITFGLESPDGNTDIHTHVSCYERDDLDDCLSTLRILIDDIRTNKVILYRGASGVYDWIEYAKLTQKENQSG